MITTETPYKLAEIIRMTWPNLYKDEKVSYNDESNQENNDRRNT
jgi:hypothetical protein